MSIEALPDTHLRPMQKVAFDTRMPEFRDIYIDIDIGYDLFLQSRTYQYICANVKHIQEDWHLIEDIFMRRSSRGNVHLLLHLTDFVDFSVMMIIRSLMHDDIYRIGIDLRRLVYRGRSEVNRIFSSKTIDGEYHPVGDWQLMPIQEVINE